MSNSRVLLFGLLVGSALPAYAATPRADVLPVQRREAVLNTARRLVQPPNAEPVPAELSSPFNPESFNAPDPDDPRGQSAARSTVAESAPDQPPGPRGDRELLETIAARIQPTGSIVVRGRSLLTFSGRTPTVGVGQSFVVTYEGQDYELEVVSIDRTTFTLRYRGEELTRPIKPTR